MPLQGDVQDDRIERPVHLLHVLQRNLDPKLVFDLVEQFSQIKDGLGFANIVTWPHSLPAIAELLNVDLPNAAGDVLGYAAAAVASLVE